MVTKFHRPRNAAEALSILSAHPAAVPLAGGTWLLAGQFRGLPLEVVSIEGLLPAGIERTQADDGSVAISLGAGATFQAIADSPVVPDVIRQAALGMADRNIRNRATVGGNIGANKSCASLTPLFFVAQGRYECLSADPASPATVPAEPWKRSSQISLVSRILLRFEADRLFAYRRWSRTACDISVITVAVSYRLETASPPDGRAPLVRDARIALGGMGACARRFPEIEAALEGRALPSRDALESLAMPFFDPISDARGSAGFKRYRAACLLAEALLDARPATSSVAALGATKTPAGTPASGASIPEVQS
jgi:CO/xanthine dehydrogenase FAD-binding subunit